jgi:hypothetical protein
MNGELLLRAQSDAEPTLDDPREGDETEATPKGGGGGGETKRALMALFASDPREGDDTEKIQETPTYSAIRTDSTALGPREGDETETSERGGGSKGRFFAAQGGPRDGDETTPIRESPLGPPVRV